MKVRYAAGTHPGMKRSHNEDNYFLLAEENLYIVADGMGGHASGEVASQIAVETVANFYIDTARDREITWPFKEDRTLVYDENRLITGVKLANRRVYETAQSDPRYRGMGTTIVTFVVGQNSAFIGHVGDSRAYLIRADNEIKQVTEDHSLLNDYLKVHKLTPEEIEHFPHKNVIVRALGMKETVTVDIHRLEPQAGDVYVLCSDGLSGLVDSASISATINENRDDLEKACQSLIAKANAAGGVDNITVVVVDFSN
ncbi:MAG: Stp1/IreP family PP2C-type Ser/Thr phosphatase [Deltaproteobacteria bacterium]|nr:Stp1/IreP family PP2C-type Ser/Thr phosphatase [Deltaproteobacteria bacterium]